MKQSIPLSKPLIGEEKKAVLDVLNSGMVAQGPRVAELEDTFAKLCGVKYALAISNGTAALHIALHAVGIKPNDEVITTPFTFAATANSILMVGAIPKFVDIDEKTFNIDPNKIESAITKKTKAILAVDLYGQPANYEAIQTLADKHNLLVVEDAAQSVGAAYKGKMSGSLANICTFSLYATKNIMCGEGGMVTTNDKKMYEAAKRFRHHGQAGKERYDYVELGYNYRMTDLNAAIALEQLKKLDWITKKRQENAKKYDTAFKSLKGIIPPSVAKDSSHVHHQYTLRITNEAGKTRDELKEYLSAKGIQADVYYPKPLYSFKHMTPKYNVRDFPVTEKILNEVLSIPVHPLLTEEQVDYIINTVKEFLK